MPSRIFEFILQYPIIFAIIAIDEFNMFLIKHKVIKERWFQPINYMGKI